MNYIITGGTGFIGTHLTNLIKERYPNAQVYNLDIVKPGTPNPVVKDYKPALKEGQKLQSTFIEYDIRKPIENLPFTPSEDDVIFNFAAVHRTPGHEDHEYFETNIRGAENVVDFAEKWGIKKIVFTSSIAPYGAAEELKKETTLPTPNTAYGISKLVAEKIHMIWQNGGNVPQISQIDTDGADIKSAKGVEIYNCCFEPAYTIQHIVEAMKKVTGLTQFVPDIPNWVIMPMARMAMLLGSPMGICPARVKKLQISTNICGEKLKNSGYQFKWSFEEALEDWFEDNDRKGLL